MKQIIKLVLMVALLLITQVHGLAVEEVPQETTPQTEERVADQSAPESLDQENQAEQVPSEEDPVDIDQDQPDKSSEDELNLEDGLVIPPLPVGNPAPNQRQVDPSAELVALQEKIKQEGNPAKKKALQKEYNEKYLAEIEAAGAEKLNPSILERFTDDARIGQYYNLVETLKDLHAKKDKSKLNLEDVEKFNVMLGSFRPPRLLTPSEKQILEEYNKNIYIPGIENPSPEWQETFDQYVLAKQKVQEGLNPEQDALDIQELQSRYDAFKALQDKIKDAVDRGEIEPKFTQGNGPEVRLYPFDFTGVLGRPLDQDQYYIPDNTPLDFLVQINKDHDNQDVTFTIRTLDVGGLDLPQSKAHTLVFLKGQPVPLTSNPDGSYSFTTQAQQDFGVAQFRFQMPGVTGLFHKGFTIEVSAGPNTLTKTFLITKKGYENRADVAGPGSLDGNHPQEIDAGKTENSIVHRDTDKTVSFFSYLTQSNTYIDRVLVNSGNGQPLPLTEVEITFALPKHGSKLAEYLHQSGLHYHDNGDGTITLALHTQSFSANLNQGQDGSLTVGNDPLTLAKLKNIVLEQGDKKVYIDQNGTVHPVETGEDDDYKVSDQTLYQKTGVNTYVSLGKFDPDGRLECDGLSYLYKAGKLYSYKKSYPVFDGHVTNKKDNGQLTVDPTVTPTLKGRQVTIVQDGKESFGGTLVENGIYDKRSKRDKRYFNQPGYQGYPEAWIDQTGKRVEPTGLSPEEEMAGQAIFNGEPIKKVEKAVFKNDYRIENLEFQPNYSLVDKFGRLIENVTVSQDGQGFSFTKTTKTKDQQGQEIVKTDVVREGQDGGRTVKVGTTDTQLFVNNHNYLVDNSSGTYSGITGPYYYDQDHYVEADPTKVVDNFYYDTLTEIPLTKKKVDYYDEGGVRKPLDPTVPRYQGSLDPTHYHTVNGKTYEQRQDATGDYYVNIEDQMDLLSTKDRVKIIQTKGSKQEVTNETSILEAIRNARFALRFPDFLAGKDVVYKLSATVSAKYLAPVFENGQWTTKVTSIFKEGNQEVPSKTLHKYFTLKNEEDKKISSDKKPEKSLALTPDNNFFNFFYRKADDRSRDQMVIDLLKMTEADKANKANKAKVELLNILQKEMARLYYGASLALDNQGQLIMLDQMKNPISIDRTLLWMVNITNKEGALFPEDPDSILSIEEYNMDNRLIYDSIILNDTQTNYEKAKEAFKNNPANAGKDFPGSDEYFFLNQLSSIQLGVNPSFVEGRFIPVGKDFTIDAKKVMEALDALAPDQNETEVVVGSMHYKVTRDPLRGQVQIQVYNAYYQGGPGKPFKSPVQAAYQTKMKEAIDASKRIDDSSIEALKKSFEEVLKKVHTIDDVCVDGLKKRMTELLTQVELDGQKALTDKGKQQLKEIKEALIHEISKLQLAYLDEAKGQYKFDDLRFNAMWIEFKPGLSIGGPRDNAKTKKIGVTSIVNPSIDIPHTDEFGTILTNKDMYLHDEIRRILQEGLPQGEGLPNKPVNASTWDKEEESYQAVYKEAYRRINEAIGQGTLRIKNLAELDSSTKRYRPVAGKTLAYTDLALGPKGQEVSLKNKYGNPINGYYVGEGKNAKSVVENVTDSSVKNTEEFKEIENQLIDLSAFYISKQGYDGLYYLNSVEFNLFKPGQAPKIFKDRKDWEHTVCQGIGHCLNKTGSSTNVEEQQGKEETDVPSPSRSHFEVNYQLAPTTTKEEHPKFEKTASKQSLHLNDSKELDFTIELTVDKLKATDKKIAEALKPKGANQEATDYSQYTSEGYYLYKNALMIDFLPDVFELQNDVQVTLTVDEQALKANGANKNLDMAAFKKAIRYRYEEDIFAYAKTLSGDQKKVMDKAIEKAIQDGRIKANTKQQAVLAWLPDFEAPHGSSKQFTLTIPKVKVNVARFQDYATANNLPTLVTNHAAFSGKADLYFAKSETRISSGPKGKVNKYLQLLDKDGNVLNSDKAQGWFQGGAELSFGSKFNYKISVYRDSGVVDTGLATTTDKNWVLDDIFAKVTDKGLRPVLRDFVQTPDDFEALYKIDGVFKSKDQITKEDLVKVTAIKLKVGKVGFPDKQTREFILPMMIPDLDAKIENGKVVYVGLDGEKKELGKAEDFFNLKDLNDRDKEVSASNQVEGSNTVTVVLKKERFIRVFKQFFDLKGKEILKNRPLVRFKLLQVETDQDGKVQEKIWPDILTLTEDNQFTAKIDKLPLFKEATSLDKDGKVVIRRLTYTYKLVELPVYGYISKVLVYDKADSLGYVFKAENTVDPTPPEYPNIPPLTPNNPGLPKTGAVASRGNVVGWTTLLLYLMGRGLSRKED